MSSEPATQRTRRAARYRMHAPMKEMPRAALFLLFLLMMTKCLAVNALADANTNADAADTKNTEFSTRDLSPVRAVPLAGSATSKGCTPGIVVLQSKAKYFCKLENAAALRGKEGLMAGYYTANKVNGFWDATLDEAAGGVWFTVTEGSGGVPGKRPFVISAIVWGRRVSVTNTIELLFFDITKTAATLEGNSLYGLTPAIATNFPRSLARIPSYRMILWGGDCQAECTTTSCYDVSNSKALPPPGSYKLCVTASDWGGRYLPWGQSSLRVSALLSASRYLVNGANNTVKLLSAATGEEVSQSSFASAYLARCRLAGCETVQPVAPESGKKDPVMSASVCNTDQRVDLEEGKTLEAESGVYAACFADKEGKATPMALSLRVVPAPFSANATITSDTTAVVSLKGGDIGQRKDRYEVRVLPEGSSCTNTNDLETKSIMRVSSDTPNSLSVTVTVPKGADIEKMRFCLVAADVTFWGHRYVTAFDMAVEVPEDVPEVSENVPEDVPVPEEKEEQKAKELPIIWIIVGSVLGFIALCGIVATICICRRRNGKASHDDDEANEPTADPNYYPQRKSKSNRFCLQKTEELS